MTVTFNANSGTVSPKSATMTNRQIYSTLFTSTKAGYKLEQYAQIPSVTGAMKPTFAIRRRNSRQGFSDSMIKQILRANAHLTKNCFHLEPYLLNRVEIRAVGRQAERYSTHRTEQVPTPLYGAL